MPMAHTSENAEMADEIQSANAYEPRFRVMMFAVYWPVNCARFATDQIMPASTRMSMSGTVIQIRISWWCAVQIWIWGGSRWRRGRTDGECEAPPRGEVRREDSVLGVVERAVPDGGDDLAENEERIAVQVVRGSAGHDHRTREMEEREHNGHQRTAKLVDVEAEADAQERVHEVCHGDLHGTGDVGTPYSRGEQRSMGLTKVANLELLIFVSLMMVVLRDLVERRLKRSC